MPNRFERGSQYNDTYWEGESGNIEKSGVNPSDLVRPEAIPRQGLMFHPETGTGRKGDPLVTPSQRQRAFSRGLGINEWGLPEQTLSPDEETARRSRELGAGDTYENDMRRPPAPSASRYVTNQANLLRNAINTNLSIHDVDPPKPSRMEEAAGVVNHRPTVISAELPSGGSAGGHFWYAGDPRVNGPMIDIDASQTDEAQKIMLVHELGHNAQQTGADGKTSMPLESANGGRPAHMYSGDTAEPVGEGVADGYADYHSSKYPTIDHMDPSSTARKLDLRSGKGKYGTSGPTSKVEFANDTSRALYGVMRQHVATGGEIPSAQYKDETLDLAGSPVYTTSPEGKKTPQRWMRRDSEPNELSLGRMVHENPHLRDMYAGDPADKKLHRAVQRAHLSYTGKLREEAHRSKVRAITGKPYNSNEYALEDLDRAKVSDQLFDPDA